MKDQILEAITERHNRIKCLYMCVNLNLVVIRQGLSGDKDIANEINAIEDLLGQAYEEDEHKFHSFVVSHYFISLVSEFEGFLVDLLRIVLRRFPAKIGSISLRLSDVAECEDIDQAIEIGASKFLNELVYKRPKEYIDTINELLSVQRSPELEDLWKKFIECKARRDLGVHNDWRVNETYNRKLTEIGEPPSQAQFLVPTNDYFVDSVDIIHS